MAGAMTESEDVGTIDLHRHAPEKMGDEEPSPVMRRAHRSTRSITASLLLPFFLAACADVPIQQGGTLSSYDHLGRESGLLSKSRAFVDKDVVNGAKTLRILPSVFSTTAAGRISEARDRALVSKALDRAICVALSDKYVIVPAQQQADLTIRNVVVDITPTGKVAAGVATAVSLGSSFVLPVSIPRIPVGLGGIAIEGEALDKTGTQRAAILWARGANSVTESPRVSEVGDAYGLAASFGGDFAQLIIKGEEPSMLDIRLPTTQRIRSFFGGEPKYPACDTFGREPGIPGMVAGAVGAPPEWADKSGDAGR